MSDGAQQAADEAAIVSARQLLIRTAELPESKSELLTVLNEYRRAPARCGGQERQCSW